MTVLVRSAEEADVDRVMELIAACIDGMRPEGIDRWMDPRAVRFYRRLGYHDAGCVTFRKGVFRCFEKALGG